MSYLLKLFCLPCCMIYIYIYIYIYYIYICIYILYIYIYYIYICIYILYIYILYIYIYIIYLYTYIIMNCFCGMVDQWKVFSFISSWDHCQRSSSLRISDMPRAGFEPEQNLISGLAEWSCAVAYVCMYYIVVHHEQSQL